MSKEFGVNPTAISQTSRRLAASFALTVSITGVACAISAAACAEDGVTVGVVATSGKAVKGQFALDSDLCLNRGL
jgi:hypothetical protein